MKDYRVSLFADYYGALLPQRSLEILRWFYDKDLSLGEIADNLCVTRQAVSETVTKASANLADFEDRLGLCRKADESRRLLAECRVAIGAGETAEALGAIESLEKLI